MAKKKTKMSKKSGSDIVTVAGEINVNGGNVKLMEIEDVKVLMLLVKYKGEKNWTLTRTDVYNLEKEKGFKREMVMRITEGDEAKVVICTTMVESSIELDEVPFIENDEDAMDGMKVNVTEESW